MYVQTRFYSPTSSAKVKNEWSYTSSPQYYNFIAWARKTVLLPYKHVYIYIYIFVYLSFRASQV